MKDAEARYLAVAKPPSGATDVSLKNRGCVSLTAPQLQAVRTDDSLVHVQWVDRTSGALVEDLIVFPEEAKLEKMPMPRCYVLKFQQGAASRS